MGLLTIFCVLKKTRRFVSSKIEERSEENPMSNLKLIIMPTSLLIHWFSHLKKDLHCRKMHRPIWSYTCKIQLRMHNYIINNTRMLIILLFFPRNLNTRCNSLVVSNFMTQTCIDPIQYPVVSNTLKIHLKIHMIHINHTGQPKMHITYARRST